MRSITQMLEIRDASNGLAGLQEDFTLPGAVGESVRWATLLGIPLVALLTVLVVGSEYVWGTLRTSLIKAWGGFGFSPPSREEFPGDVHALVVQLVWAALIGLVAFRIFHRRDVTGPSG